MVSDPDGCEWFAATVFDRFVLQEVVFNRVLGGRWIRSFIIECVCEYGTPGMVFVLMSCIYVFICTFFI